MKPKEARCQFNRNRKFYKIAIPTCTWAEETITQLPPHLLWQSTQKINCTQCKCFKAAKRSE